MPAVAGWVLDARRPARELTRTRDDVHDRDEQARADKHKRPHYPVGRGHLRLNTLIRRFRVQARLRDLAWGSLVGIEPQVVRERVRPPRAPRHLRARRAGLGRALPLFKTRARSFADGF